MDTQDKLIINHTFQNFVKEINLNDIDEDSVLFNFNEYEPIVITLNSENYKISMECYSYYNGNNYIICDNNELEINNNESYKISDSNNIVDIGYIPSKYYIYIYNLKNNKKTNCYFNVNSNKELSEDGMENIISHINDFIDGLSIDFFKNTKINNINISEKNSDYYIHELILKNYSKISYNVDNVLKNLKYCIDSDIKEEKYEKKQNYKTMKKNFLKFNDLKFYNIKKIVSLNDNDNIILKKYIVKIKNILEDSYLNIDKNINDQLDILRKQNDERKNIETRIDNLSLSRIDLRDSNNHLKSIISEINTTEQWIDKLYSWQYAYDNCVILLNKVLESDEFLNISIQNNISNSVSFFNNNNYKFFYNLYMELITYNSLKYRKQNKNIFSNKKSYTLFELYGFIVIQNILKELDFKLELGNEDLFTFGSDSEFIYLKEDIKIKIQYDHYCKKYRSTGAVNIGDIVNKNSINCKPDYIISIFDKNGILYDAIVIEMKYRRLKYLTDFGGGSTETDVTIDDYSQLCGIIKDIKKPNNIISNVIILYPSLSEKIFDRNSGLFVGINAEKNFNESNAYNRIKNIIIGSLGER